MLNLTGSPSKEAEMADRLADQLGDDLSLVRKRPYTDAFLAMAERIGLPGLQCSILEALAKTPVEWKDSAQLEQGAKYLGTHVPGADHAVCPARPPLTGLPGSGGDSRCRRLTRWLTGS